MSLLPPKVTLMSVCTSNTYMKLQNFRKLGKNAKLSKKWTLPISGQNLFPEWCPLIRDYTAELFNTKFLMRFCMNCLNQLWLQFVVFVYFNERPFQVMNNAFYFDLKALFVLKIFDFLSWPFWSCRKATW